MPILKNPKHELFCQRLAAGMGQTEAYEAAGYTGDRKNASRLATSGDIGRRVAELLTKSATTTESAISAKQRFIAKAWEKVADAVDLMAPEDAADIKALVDSALNAEKDQRVVDGGVSDRQDRTLTVDERKRAAKERTDAAFARMATENAKPGKTAVH